MPIQLVVIVGGGCPGWPRPGSCAMPGCGSPCWNAPPAGREVGPGRGGRFHRGPGAREALLARRPEAVDLVRAVGLGEDLVHRPPRRPACGVAGWSVRCPRARHGVPLESAGATPQRGADRGRPGTRRRRATVAGARGAGRRSVGVWVRSRWGAEVVDRLVDPLLGGVWAGHADGLSLRAAAPSLAAAAFAGHRLRRPAPTRARCSPASRGSGPPDPRVGGGQRRPLRHRVTVRGLTRRQHDWQLPCRADHRAGVDRGRCGHLAVPPRRGTPAGRGGARRRGTSRQIEYASAAIITLVLPPAPRPLVAVASWCPRWRVG